MPAGRGDVVEKKMFGGLAFTVSGNMCCGVSRGDLVVRVGPAAYAAALAEKQVREMDFTGKPLRVLSTSRATPLAVTISCRHGSAGV